MQGANFRRLVLAIVGGIAMLGIAAPCSAADWQILFDAPDQLHEWNRSGVRHFEGRRYVEHRVTFKQEQTTDSGTRFKFMMMAAAYSCKDRTESIEMVSRFSSDRKLIGKHMLPQPIVQRPAHYNHVEKILQAICPKGE